MARVQKVKHCRSSVLWGDSIDERYVQFISAVLISTCGLSPRFGHFRISLIELWFENLFLRSLAVLLSEMLLGTALRGEMSEEWERSAELGRLQAVGEHCDVTS